MRIYRVALFYLLVFAGAVAVAPVAPFAQIGVAVSIAPPVLPVYEQPPIPAPGYIWTPGYWAYGPYGYYWVPGTWVQPPGVGLLWTPGYWGWGGSGYAWRAGYWGPQVGFYGGIDYGHGYGGNGYQGGYWNNGALYYNRSVNNLSNTNISNVYTRNVVTSSTSTVSYNGGTGGVRAAP
ncbi:MAG: YXWGXW repeat-containing protein, partial [Stellaceae bacterium]